MLYVPQINKKKRFNTPLINTVSTNINELKNNVEIYISLDVNPS